MDLFLILALLVCCNKSDTSLCSSACEIGIITIHSGGRGIISDLDLFQAWSINIS